MRNHPILILVLRGLLAEIMHIQCVCFWTVTYLGKSSLSLSWRGWKQWALKHFICEYSVPTSLRFIWIKPRKHCFSVYKQSLLLCINTNSVFASHKTIFRKINQKMSTELMSWIDWLPQKDGWMSQFIVNVIDQIHFCGEHTSLMTINAFRVVISLYVSRNFRF